MEEKESLKKLKEYEKIGTLKEFKELYKIKTTDYIHRGEGVTERDYYYYTNGAQAVLDEVEQLKKENEQLKQELGNYKLLNAVFGEDKNEAVAREKLIKNQKIVMDGFAKQLCEEQQTVKQLKQQLAEKEELLKNVNNDFKIGDTVYVIRKLKQDIRCGRIEYIWDGNHKNNWRRYRVNLPKVNSVTKLKHELFATKAEAQKKLEESNGK